MSHQPGDDPRARSNRPGGVEQPVGAHSIGEAERRRPWWLWLLLGFLALALLLLALSRCGGDPSPTGAVTTPTTTSSATGAASASPSATDTASASATDSASASPSLTDTASATGDPAATPTQTDTASGTATSTGTATTTPSATASAGGDSPLSAGDAALLPLASAAGAGGDLTQYVGDPARATGVRVQSVPTDEGFWVGTSATDRVWVQLTATGGESRFRVKAGDRVDFSGGEIVANAAGFVEEIGITAAEGARQLTAQKAHIEIPARSLKLSE